MDKSQFSLSSKTILLTGAAGKLASYFIKDFLGLGARVVGIDIADNFSHDLAPFENSFIYRKLLCC